MFLFGWKFNLYQLSLTVGLLATYCMRFGLSWWTLEATGSTTAFASMIASSTLVEIYSRPIFSPMGDYFNRSRLVSGSYALVAILSLAACLFATSGFFNLYLLYALLMSISLVTAVREPASSGMLPELVDASKLIEAYASRAAVSSAANIVVPMIAAAALGNGGWKSNLYIGSASAAIAALCAIKIATQGKKSSESFSIYIQTWHVKIGEGLRATFLVRTEFQLALVAAVLNFSLYPFFFVVLPIWVTSELGLGKEYIGIIEGSFAVGMTFSGWITATFLAKHFTLFARVIIGTTLLGSGIALAGTVGDKYAILASLTFAGIGFTLFNIGTGALRAAATPNEYRSRLYAGVAFVSSCANPIAVLLAGALMEFIRPGYLVISYGLLIILVAFLIPLISNLQSIMNMNVSARSGLYLSLYPKAFNLK